MKASLLPRSVPGAGLFALPFVAALISVATCSLVAPRTRGEPNFERSKESTWLG